MREQPLLPNLSDCARRRRDGPFAGTLPSGSASARCPGATPRVHQPELPRCSPSPRPCAA